MVVAVRLASIWQGTDSRVISSISSISISISSSISSSSSSKGP